VRRASDVPGVLERAFVTAIADRPGPVVIELPFDIQGQPLDAEAVAIRAPAPSAPTRDAVASAMASLASAERPLILAGGGARFPRPAAALRELVATTGIPIVTSIAALDVMPSTHPLRVGLIGMYGTRAANLVMSESDAVLVVGSRLDAGLIGADTSAWERGRAIVRVDCDAGELRSRLKRGTHIEADAEAFLAEAVRVWPARTSDRLASWRDRVAALLREHPDTAEHPIGGDINPNVFMRELSEAS